MTVQKSRAPITILLLATFLGLAVFVAVPFPAQAASPNWTDTLLATPVRVADYFVASIGSAVSNFWDALANLWISPTDTPLAVAITATTPQTQSSPSSTSSDPAVLTTHAGTSTSTPSIQTVIREMKTEVKIVDNTALASLTTLVTNLQSRLTVAEEANQSALRMIGLTNRINNLGNVTFTSNTNTFNLSDGDIPDTITASNYLALSGGSLTSNLGIGTSTPGGLLSVSASSTIPALMLRQATSTNSGNLLSFISGTSDIYGQEIGNVKGLNLTIKGSITDATQLDGAFVVHVSGRYAYVAAQTADRLTVVDVSNPSSPTVVGSVSSSQLDTANAVYVSGRYAYVAASGNADSLTIVDVSNPSNPTIVGSITSSQFDGARDVYVSGRYAYVASETADRLTVVDVSNPTSPTIVGSVTSTQLDSAYAVHVSGRYAYVAAGNADSLTIVDVSNPASPVIVGSVSSSQLDTAREVYVSGRYAYVTAYGADSLTIVDVSNPASPVIVGSVSSSQLDTAHYVYVSGRYAYVTADDADRFTIVDVSNPANPFIVGSITSTQLDLASAVYVSGRYAYVAAHAADSLIIIELPGLDIPTVLTGDIQTGTLEAWENVDVGNDLIVRGGGTFGQGGVFANGPGSFSTFATTSLLNIPALSGSITDSNLSSVIDILKLTHMASSTAASGIGTGLLFSAENTSGTTTDIARISSIFTDAGGSATTSVLTFSTLSGYTFSEKMRIDQSGNVGIGTTSPSAKLSITQTTNTRVGGFWLASTDGDFRSVYMDTSGVLSFEGGDGGTINTATLNAAGAWTNASDIVYKEDIQDLAYGLPELLQLQPRSYLMKGSGLKQIGFVAQELEKIIPEVVSGEDGQKGISYGNLTALLVKSVQDLAKTVESGAASVIASIKELVVDILHAKRVTTDELKVGTPDKPTGITLYDEDTKTPYCLHIKSGEIIKTAGECTPTPATTPTATSETPTSSEETAAVPAEDTSASADAGDTPISAEPTDTSSTSSSTTTEPEEVTITSPEEPANVAVDVPTSVEGASSVPVPDIAE